jgi:hypothetical protein
MQANQLVAARSTPKVVSQGVPDNLKASAAYDAAM